MAGPRLHLIDDDQDYCRDLAATLPGKFTVTMDHDPEVALGRLAEINPDLILLDIDFGPGQMSGLEVLEQIRAGDDPPPVIMLSGKEDVPTVVKAIKLGAFHYVTKFSDLPELLNLIVKALEFSRHSLELQAMREEVGRLTGSFIWGDEVTQRLLEQVDKVAATDATVLITGESGTGKEMIARRIHQQSAAAAGPFVGINCGAFPTELIEAEIFGHEKGAFYGADTLKIGKFELASGGSLFLDEVGEGSQAFQVKLLRALGERHIQRLGGNTDITVDARIMAATSQDLEKAMAEGSFRPELFYRLNLFRIELPPLRRRPGDILPLARHFLAEVCRAPGKQITGFSATVERCIQDYPWPGNVRELKNAVRRAAILCEASTVAMGDWQVGPVTVVSESESFAEAKAREIQLWETRFISDRLQSTGGNVTRAAELCGMSRQALQNKMRDLGLHSAAFKGEKDP